MFHHLEYVVAYNVTLAQAFGAAKGALLARGYREATTTTGRALSLDAWPLLGPAATGARLRLPRGCAGGDEIAARLATDLPAATLRLHASAGDVWGWDAFGAGGDRACRFCSDHPRNGDEAAVLALWAGHGRATKDAIEKVIDPRSDAGGPDAVQRLAEALAVPYPAGDELARPALHAALVVHGEPS